VKFSSEQIEMLSMSEDDIKDGNIISESELDKSDDKCFNKNLLDENCHQSRELRFRVLERQKQK
ncbi:MAG: hypothetical protein M9926_09070, partial [Lentimicrobium sp.]|uniref:hypothetical protein n=1 Tax=Lentimicrobium sp. TaxID=2034841 RepID=UPI0026006F67